MAVHPHEAAVSFDWGHGDWDPENAPSPATWPHIDARHCVVQDEAVRVFHEAKYAVPTLAPSVLGILMVHLLLLLPVIICSIASCWFGKSLLRRLLHGYGDLEAQLPLEANPVTGAYPIQYLSQPLRTVTPVVAVPAEYAASAPVYVQPVVASAVQPVPAQVVALAASAPPADSQVYPSLSAPSAGPAP
jgi:hypothetical protein